MEQKSLFPTENERVLELQEVESGFDVLNDEDFEDIEVKLSHSPNKKTNEKIGMTKEQFETYAKKCYKVDKVKWINLVDEKGEFTLKDVLIKYTFTAEGSCPNHLEFNSDKIPNLISETGYRSEFFNFGELEDYSNVQEVIKDYCKDKKLPKPIFKDKEGKDIILKDEIIDKEFVLREDLRDWLFKEDSEGTRYRERIIDVIEEIGVENWFKLKGYPTDEKSVWKNRYTKGLTTLGQEIHEFDSEKRIGTFEEKCYYLWENWLPVDIWNDRELSKSYKEGTKEYADRIKEEQDRDKKYKKSKDKTLFGDPKPKKSIKIEEEEEDLDEDFSDTDDEENSDTDYDYAKEIEKEEIDFTEVEKSRSKLCREQNEEYCHLTISLTNTGKLAEPKLSLGSTHEMPKGKLGSSWGGSYEISNNNDELMAKFLEFFKTNAELPYADIDSPFTTTLKIENCWVEFSKSAKEFMIKNGFDFNKYEEEVKKITQRKATQEDISKGKTFEIMEKSMNKLRDECWAIKGYFESFLNRHLDTNIVGGRYNQHKGKGKPYHIERMEKLGIDYSDLNKLKELYDSKQKIYHIYYCKVNEQRFGKPCDEEYSYA
jgi:hypothetical protein